MGSGRQLMGNMASSENGQEPTGRRGEVFLGEDGPRLFYSNYALAQAEAQMGRSVLGVMRSLSDGDASIQELATLLFAGLEGARRQDGGRNRPHTMRDAFRLMDNYGFAPVVEAVALGITAVIAPTEPAEEDADPN
jgi:hypothetical protein